MHRRFGSTENSLTGLSLLPCVASIFCELFLWQVLLWMSSLWVMKEHLLCGRKLQLQRGINKITISAVGKEADGIQEWHGPHHWEHCSLSICELISPVNYGAFWSTVHMLPVNHWRVTGHQCLCHSAQSSPVVCYPIGFNNIGHKRLSL